MFFAQKEVFAADHGFANAETARDKEWSSRNVRDKVLFESVENAGK